MGQPNRAVRERARSMSLCAMRITSYSKTLVGNSLICFICRPLCAGDKPCMFIALAVQVVLFWLARGL